MCKTNDKHESNGLSSIVRHHLNEGTLSSATVRTFLSLMLDKHPGVHPKQQKSADFNALLKKASIMHDRGRLHPEHLEFWLQLAEHERDRIILHGSKLRQLLSALE